MTATHDLDITINVNLGAAPLVEAGYAVLFLVDEASGNALDGDRVRSYTVAGGEAAADETAGFISTATKNAINVALAQRPAPSILYVGRVDTVGGESYSDALALVDAEIGDQFWAIVADTRTAADQVALAATVEARENALFLQSSDADWLTTGLPAAYSTLAGLERTAVIYHDTDTERADLAWAAKFLAVDPDFRASPGTVPLKSVSALATPLTSTQRGFVLANNASVALPFGPELAYVSRAVNANGRPIHEILTADWFTRDLRAGIGRTAATLGAANRKWPVTVQGAGILKSLVEATGNKGINAGHFEAGQFVATTIAPTTSDTDSGTLRGSARAQIGNTAVIWVVGLDASRTPLDEA